MWGKIISFIATHFAWPLLKDAIIAAYVKIKSAFKKAKSKKKSKHAAAEAAKKMEKAKTAKELDDASDDTLSGI